LSPFHIRRIDGLLLLMSVIWGSNYVIVKHAFTQIDAQAFNAIRLVIASTIFMAAMGMIRRLPRPWRVERSLASTFYTPTRVTRRDLIDLAGLAVVGQWLYQYWFVGGLARTSVSNAALIAASAPVLIAFASAVMGKERVTAVHWLGATLSLIGIYIVVGRGLTIGGSTLAGDLMVFAAVCCWAIYTLWSRTLMLRHSPVAVTGLSMTMGTLMYVPSVIPHLRTVAWDRVALGTWMAVTYSAVFALCVSYTIWYAAVREIGSARTSVYSNVVPLVAMAAATVFLGEPLGLRKLLGAGAVLAGVGLTRVKLVNPNPE
jgi:drug/metabolite transporter (DMT)-like permease